MTTPKKPAAATPPAKRKKRRRPGARSAHRALLYAHRHLYKPLLRFQGGVCALCGNPPKNRKLDMDHDHKSMKVRGLLCVRCNRSLADWQSPDWLRRAAAYLEHPPAKDLVLEGS